MATSSPLQHQLLIFTEAAFDLNGLVPQHSGEVIIAQNWQGRPKMLKILRKVYRGQASKNRAGERSPGWESGGGP
jgi:hypothetical protein